MSQEQRDREQPWVLAGRQAGHTADELLAATNMTVLPGSFMSRDAHGTNPGRGFVRIALVSTLEETLEAARRLEGFAARLSTARAGMTIP